MTDRIHEYLDGERDRASLTPEEAATADRLDGAAREAASPLRSTPSVDLTHRVMARVNALPAPERRRSPFARAAGWLTQPREVSFAMRPVYGMVAAALVLVVTLGALGGTQGVGDEDIAVAPESEVAPVIYVQFTLREADASRISLAGSFSDWEPRYELSRTPSGVWTVMVPLEPGVHDYAFVIDGDRWVVDPDAPQVDDDFGGANNRLPIVSPRGS